MEMEQPGVESGNVFVLHPVLQDGGGSFLKFRYSTSQPVYMKDYGAHQHVYGLL